MLWKIYCYTLSWVLSLVWDILKQDIKLSQFPAVTPEEKQIVSPGGHHHTHPHKWIYQIMWLNQNFLLEIKLKYFLLNLSKDAPI